MKARTLLSLLSVLLFTGCVSAPSVSMASQDSDAEAKKFLPPDGKANIYLAWSGASGLPTSFDVSIDGKAAGSIVPGTFLLVIVDPGTHGVAVSGRIYSAKETLDAQAGKNYFYEVTASSGGLTAKPSLGFVLLEPMGKIMVNQNKRAQGPAQ